MSADEPRVHIDKISAYHCGAQEPGIAVQMQATTGDDNLLPFWHEMTTFANRRWAKAFKEAKHEQLLREMLAQLEAVARGEPLGDLTPKQTRVLMLCNIYLLQKHNCIPPGHFCGLQMVLTYKKEEAEEPQAFVFDGALAIDLYFAGLTKSLDQIKRDARTARRGPKYPRRR